MAALLNLCGEGDSCHETCASVARHVGACILVTTHGLSPFQELPGRKS